MKKLLPKIFLGLGMLLIAAPVFADLAPIGINDPLLTTEPTIPQILILLLTIILTIGLTLFIEFPWYYFGIGKTFNPWRHIGTWLAANAVTLPIILLVTSIDDTMTTIIFLEMIITFLEMLLIGTIAKSITWVRAGWVALAANFTSAIIGTMILKLVLTALGY